MKSKFKIYIDYVRWPLLYLSFYTCKCFVKEKPNSWMIGIHEVARFLFSLGQTLRPSKTVCLASHNFYDFKYDFHLPIKNKYLLAIVRFFYAPMLLGYLANTSSHFLYIGSVGLMYNREKEFHFLKSKNKKIIFLFLGSEIRSPKLALAYAKEHNIDVFMMYIQGEDIAKRDLDIKELSLLADTYGDLIFSSYVDQISYIKKDQFGMPYMYDKRELYSDMSKFMSAPTIKIVHAPSNPLIKGTPLVRAGSRKLEVEGYLFEYVELQGASNIEVLEHLRSAHIVLNQFYAFVPGMFGIEAMANSCAVLMSADPSVEKTLPLEGKEAWMITHYWEIYDNLKQLLDNPEEIETYAQRGYDFVEKHYTYEAAGRTVQKVLEENGILE